jgi:hypothetical protein
MKLDPVPWHSTLGKRPSTGGHEKTRQWLYRPRPWSGDGGSRKTRQQQEALRDPQTRAAAPDVSSLAQAAVLTFRSGVFSSVCMVACFPRGTISCMALWWVMLLEQAGSVAGLIMTLSPLCTRHPLPIEMLGRPTGTHQFVQRESDRMKPSTSPFPFVAVPFSIHRPGNQRKACVHGAARGGHCSGVLVCYVQRLLLHSIW